ncbi:signal peptide peptidase SppA, 36K type [Bartonella sp. DB5-6]|uniref:S49 family peptidase n=1 Tax=Bartonella sp. DB5-6 TaxID=1094755 RepID=UPI00026E9EAB|nr:S49 family peptidase [Bartonella sp. DB5-6]EJF74310.1 signal peptide peptidase SppA, 36K type [Bartonella sp. DB5-6]EJF74428.1 signal peptide peptidase SppA, 36K type [Bartonella sp. DB5-6]
MVNNLDMPFLVSRLFGVPHMLASTKLDVILNALAPRLFEGEKFPPKAFAQGDTASFRPPETYVVQNNIAILPVHGTLVRRGAWLGALSGLTSYEGLRASFREAIAQPDVRAVLLDIDSSGGEAGGVFDLVEEFQTLSKQYNKPIWAHANEFACSAAYAIACAASQIWVARTGVVGSIGVVCAHLDQSRADEKHGHKWTFVFEGDHKVHGNSHEPLSDTAQIKMQADCALLYEMFVDLVAQNRPLNADAIRDTKAETFIGTQALKLGLADAQGTLAQALETLTDSISQNPTSTTEEGQNTWHAHNTAPKKKMMMKRLSTSSMTRKRMKTIATSTKTPKTSTTKKMMRTKTMRTMKTSVKT